MDKLFRLLVVSCAAWAAFSVIAEGTCSAGATSRDVVRITKEDLRTLLDKPEPPVIIDVRSDRDWKQSSRRIKGAVHEDPMQEESWAGKYPKDKPLILYCA